MTVQANDTMLQSRSNEHHTASYRIAFNFLRLLEQQFPVINAHHTIELRYPHQFANQLNVHVNHLNRAIKRMVGKTTSDVISERILSEANKLLIENQMTISEIAFALGFSEPTHFTNFFKKRVKISPVKFRQVQCSKFNDTIEIAYRKKNEDLYSKRPSF